MLLCYLRMASVGYGMQPDLLRLWPSKKTSSDQSSSALYSCAIDLASES